MSILSKFALWWQFTRPATLVASLCPLALVFADHFSRGGQLAPATTALLIACALAIQICCNWVNDYYDHLRGADEKNIRLGPMRALQKGLLHRKQVLYAIIFLAAFVFFSSLYFLFAVGWIFAFILLLSLFLAYLYTGSRYSLAYHGLGEIFAFVFFGPVIVLSSMAIVNGGVWIIDYRGLSFSLVCGLFALALITVNNYRDLENDRRVKKITMAAYFGDYFCKVVYLACIGFLIGIPIFLFLYEKNPLLLFPLAALPLFVTQARFILFRQKEEMNRLLKKTGVSYFLYTVFFVAALLAMSLPNIG